jgi:hypothetical protein
MSAATLFLLLLFLFLSRSSVPPHPHFRPVDCGPVCQAREAGASSCVIGEGVGGRKRLGWCSRLGNEIRFSRCWIHGWRLRSLEIEGEVCR